MKSNSLAIAAGLAGALLVSLPAAADDKAAPPAAAVATPSAPATPATPAAAPSAPAAPGKETAKRDACRATIRDEKLKGQDRMDSMQVCMMQARLDCLKEAIAKKITDNAKRRDYVKTCVTE